MKGIKQGLLKNGPSILTLLGVIGLIGSTILGSVATKKSCDVAAKMKNDNPNVTKKEIVKKCWKNYIPCIVTSVASSACIVGANSINKKIQLSLATAHTLTETAFLEYKNEVKKMLGEGQESKVTESLYSKKVEECKKNQSVLILPDGKYPCYDPLSDQIFMSSSNKIRSGINELNRRMIRENYISLAEFWDELEIPKNKNRSKLLSGDRGHLVGWNVSKGLIDVSFSYIPDDDTGQPILALDYMIEPYYDYDHFG